MDDAYQNDNPDSNNVKIQFSPKLKMGHFIVFRECRIDALYGRHFTCSLNGNPFTYNHRCSWAYAVRFISDIKSILRHWERIQARKWYIFILVFFPGLLTGPSLLYPCRNVEYRITNNINSMEL